MPMLINDWSKLAYSMKITERNPKNSNENEKRRQKVKSAKSAKMGKGNIF